MIVEYYVPRNIVPFPSDLAVLSFVNRRPIAEFSLCTILLRRVFSNFSAVRYLYSVVRFVLYVELIPKLVQIIPIVNTISCSALVPIVFVKLCSSNEIVNV